MRRTYLLAALTLSILGGAILSGLPENPNAHACSYGFGNLRLWINDALAEDPSLSGQGISLLREAGPRGLQALLRHEANLPAAPTDANESEQAAKAAALRLRYIAAVDEVGGQRDCRVSKLYWYTDLGMAKVAAQASGKPILSLRLLGKLTDELSCANSRFFRSTLYANTEVSQVLRSKYILHWQSVRPVPKVTIDFGDGRKLERTLTGNSIHYVLDGEGRPIDALPGLYGPGAFLRGLEQASGAFEGSKQLNDGDRHAYLREYHAARSQKILANWYDDLQRVGATIHATADAPVASHTRTATEVSVAVTPDPRAKPDALAAGNLAITKRVVEMPILNATMRQELLTQAQLPRTAKALPVNTQPTNALLATALPIATNEIPSADLLSNAGSDEIWSKIAALHAEDAQLDQASRNHIAAKNPHARQAGALAISKSRVENPILRMVRVLQSSIALDTVKNEYLFHRQIHDWLAAGPNSAPDSNNEYDVDVLNERVYAELFLTPSSDPWLGLMPADTYTALENNGVVSK